MFKITKNSNLVKAWVTMILAGMYTIDDVPTFFGLKNAVVEKMQEVSE